jgi:hypothetical protein
VITVTIRNLTFSKIQKTFSTKIELIVTLQTTNKVMQKQMAEWGGFEPPVQFLDRTTV